MAVSAGSAERGVALRRFLLPLGGIVGLAVVAVGLVFLADKHGAQNLLGSVFDLLGNDAAAAGVRAGVTDQILAKLVLAAVALVAGVGGIWLLYAGLASLASLFRPGIRDRIMPWIFIVPALLLLAAYLVYPG